MEVVGVSLVGCALALGIRVEKIIKNMIRGKSLLPNFATREVERAKAVIRGNIGERV